MTRDPRRANPKTSRTQRGVLELVPHRPPLCLLDRVTAFADGRLTCAAEVQSDCPLLVDGALPGWALVEHVAQAAAALRGIEAPNAAQSPGYLVAVQQAELDVDTLRTGTVLEVTVWREGRPRGGLAQLRGEVSAQGSVLCRAGITVREK